MALKIRLLGIALWLAAGLLAFQLVSLFSAGAHFGSPALQVCAGLTASPQLGEPCRILRGQIAGLTKASRRSAELLALSAVVAFFLGAAAITISVEKPRSPPNNSSKPTPLRGAA